jgi:hypothetical protein
VFTGLDSFTWGSGHRVSASSASFAAIGGHGSNVTSVGVGEERSGETGRVFCAGVDGWALALCFFC